MRLKQTLALAALTSVASWGIALPVLAQDATAPATQVSDASIPEVVVSAARGQEVTLGLGADDGVRAGAIYTVSRNGIVLARLRVTQTSAHESIATVFDADPEFSVAVGETASFEKMGTIVTPPAMPVAPPAPSGPLDVGEPLPPVAPTTSTPAMGTPAKSTLARTAAVPAAFGGNKSTPASGATITAINNAEIEINAGSTQGVREGATLPILSGGNIVALARIQSVQPNSSNGAIIWQDENAPALAVGLSVGMVGAPRKIDDGAIAVPVDVAPDTPAAPIAYETGLSNVVVPRTDRTYQYLATLATNGLITRYPASLFRDDGRNYHRTEEDLAFTRAQITDLIRESVANVENKGGQANSSSALALSALAREYSRELKKAGLVERVAAVSNREGFGIGFSGEVRASVVGGDNNNVFEPFSERQGGRRTESGADARFNLFGQIGKNLTFFSELEGGTDYRTTLNPLPNSPLDDRNFQLRRALISYDAGNLLRGLTIEAGRNEFWWGPGHFGTLSLSDASGPLNMLSYKFERGSYVAQGLYSPLGTGPGGKKRALYAKNNYVKLGNQTRLGFTETVLSPNNTYDPILAAATFSPLPLIVLDRLRDTQFGQNEDTNSSFSAYLESSVARGLRTYGEILIDDISVDSGNRLRNRLGTVLGAHLFTARDPANAGIYLEYANLQGQTYLDFRGDPDYDFYDNGRPFGYAVAPPQNSANPGGGAESLRFDAYYRVTPKLRLGVGAELADLQSEEINRFRQQTYRLRAHYDFARNFTLTARAQRVKTSQPALAPGIGIPETQQNLLQLEVSRAF